jgi:hypothetical protein
MAALLFVFDEPSQSVTEARDLGKHGTRLLY